MNLKWALIKMEGAALSAQIKVDAAYQPRTLSGLKAASTLMWTRPGLRPAAAPGSDIALEIPTLLTSYVRLEPTNVQQIGNELAIHWNDGTESFFRLELLRRACPCAACGGEPDVLGNISRPHVTYTNQSFELTAFNLVGGYALQPHWRDGHQTGIYAFQYLRRLADSHVPGGSS